MIDEKYTSVDWLQDNHTNIHPFGLGFIQVKLNDHERMHFWHPDFQREREEVHNHRYDFHSRVIRGSMSQEIYTFDQSLPLTHDMIETDCRPANEKDDTPLLIHHGHLKHVLNVIYAEGSQYWLTDTTFHRVEATKCVTHLWRSPKKKPFAQIITERDSPLPSCPFEEKMTDDAMWQLVRECLQP